MNSLWVQASFFSDKTNRGTATDFQRLAIQLQKLYIIVFKTVYNSYTIEFLVAIEFQEVNNNERMKSNDCNAITYTIKFTFVAKIILR